MVLHFSIFDVHFVKLWQFLLCFFNRIIFVINYLFLFFFMLIPFCQVLLFNLINISLLIKSKLFLFLSVPVFHSYDLFMFFFYFIFQCSFLISWLYLRSWWADVRLSSNECCWNRNYLSTRTWMWIGWNTSKAFGSMAWCLVLFWWITEFHSYFLLLLLFLLGLGWWFCFGYKSWLVEASNIIIAIICTFCTTFFYRTLIFFIWALFIQIIISSLKVSIWCSDRKFFLNWRLKPISWLESLSSGHMWPCIAGRILWIIE